MYIFFIVINYASRSFFIETPVLPNKYYTQKQINVVNFRTLITILTKENRLTTFYIS